MTRRKTTARKPNPVLWPPAEYRLPETIDGIDHGAPGQPLLPVGCRLVPAHDDSRYGRLRRLMNIAALVDA